MLLGKCQTKRCARENCRHGHGALFDGKIPNGMSVRALYILSHSCFTTDETVKRETPTFAQYIYRQEKEESHDLRPATCDKTHPPSRLRHFHHDDAGRRRRQVEQVHQQQQKADSQVIVLCQEDDVIVAIVNCLHSVRGSISTRCRRSWSHCQFVGADLVLCGSVRNSYESSRQ